MVSNHRFCLLDPFKKPLSVTVHLEDGLMAGGDFKLIDEKKNVIESFKVSVEDGKSYVHKFKTPVEKVNKAKLIWSILICSKNPNTFIGELELEFLQMGLKTKLTSPTKYVLKNIPPCSFKNAEQVKGSLFFVLNNDVVKL
jgi:hypothetical protein